MCLRGLGISTHKTVSHKGPRQVGIEDKFIVQSMPLAGIMMHEK